MGQLFEELKRRNVFRVGFGYAVGAWVLTQIADVIADALNFPDWFMQMLLLVLAIGFLVALFLAWAYELTPEGVKKTKGVDNKAPEASQPNGRIDRAILGILVVAVLYLIVDPFPDDKLPSQSEEGTSQPSSPSIGEAGTGSEAEGRKEAVEKAWLRGCDGYIRVDIAATMKQAEGMSGRSAAAEFFEGRCVTEPGWELVSNGDLRTDDDTGTKFVWGHFEPGQISGRVYLLGTEPKIEKGDRVKAFGRVSKFRMATVGRNPSTGERVDVPPSIYLVGAVRAESSDTGRSEAPTMQELDNLVLMLVSLHYGKAVRDITGDEKFAQDFEDDPNPVPGIGDLRLIEVIIALEDAAPCSIPDDAVQDADSVNDLRLAATKYCETR